MWISHFWKISFQFDGDNQTLSNLIYFMEGKVLRALMNIVAESDESSICNEFF